MEGKGLPNSGTVHATVSFKDLQQRSVEGALQVPTLVTPVACKPQLPILDASQAILPPISVSVSLATARPQLNDSQQRSVEKALQVPSPITPVAIKTQLPISDASKAILPPIGVSVSLATALPSLSSPSYASLVVPCSIGVLDFHSRGFTLSSGAINFGGGIEQPVKKKKKKGRPRKYGPHGSTSLSVAPMLTAPRPIVPSDKSIRSPRSGENQHPPATGELMGGSAGVGIMPHAVTVANGEDVAARIMSFSQQGHKGICILSANGAISNATLRQSAVSGGTVTYEGRFEILSLSGSFLLTDCGGARSRTGGLSVLLAGPDGRVVGGGVAGILVAASPVQVILGSFMYNPTTMQARPSNPGFRNFFPSYTTNTVMNSVPLSFSNDATDVKPVASESPLNQSSGAATSSNAETSHGQEDD